MNNSNVKLSSNVMVKKKCINGIEPYVPYHLLPKYLKDPRNIDKLTSQQKFQKDNLQDRDVVRKDVNEYDYDLNDGNIILVLYDQTIYKFNYPIFELQWESIGFENLNKILALKLDSNNEETILFISEKGKIYEKNIEDIIVLISDDTHISLNEVIYNDDDRIVELKLKSSLLNFQTSSSELFNCMIDFHGKFYKEPYNGFIESKLHLNKPKIINFDIFSNDDLVLLNTYNKTLLVEQNGRDQKGVNLIEKFKSALKFNYSNYYLFVSSKGFMKVVPGYEFKKYENNKVNCYRLFEEKNDKIVHVESIVEFSQYYIFSSKGRVYTMSVTNENLCLLKDKPKKVVALDIDERIVGICKL